jgi:hypothetical protein
MTLVFILTGLTAACLWTEKNRFGFLSKEYPLFVGKFELMDHYSQPGLVIFGDSDPMAGILPVELNPKTINLSLAGTSPEEVYFLGKRLMKGSIRPSAVLISISPYHFVHVENFWERGVKFGVIGSQEANEVLNIASQFKEKQFLLGAGSFAIDGKLEAFLKSFWLPTYYLSSIIAGHFNERKKENEEALEVVLAARGQFYMGTKNGSKEIGLSAKLDEFKLSPVINYYFMKTLRLFKDGGIPVYFIAMPIKNSSRKVVEPLVMKDFKNYIKKIAKEDSNFHVLSNLETFYSWKYYGDSTHLNEKGAERFTEELAHSLNKAGVPGGPYGVLVK